MSLANNLRQLMFQERLKAIDLSNDTSVPQATIHRMLTGESKSPHKSSLLPIAERFSISIEQLLGIMPIDWSSSHPTQLDLPNQVSVYGMDQLIELYSGKENIKPKSKTVVDQKVNPNAIATLLEDDSMIPLFPPKTQIIIDPDKEFTDGAYVLVFDPDNNKLLFRQLLIDGKDGFLKPLNPDISHFKVSRFCETFIKCGTLIQAKLNFE